MSRGTTLGAAGTTLLVLVLAGCASPAPPAALPQPLPRSAADLGRVVIVPSGDSTFVVRENRAEPGRTFDEVVKWTPYQWLRPLGTLLHSSVNRLLDAGRAAPMVLDVGGRPPQTVVAAALSRRLHASGAFQDVRVLDREPLDAEGLGSDARIRVRVLTWGLVRVREGQPDLLSAFADIHAQMTLDGSGVIVWERNEDVTHPERLSLESFARDPRFTRQQLNDVLQRAGERLATELLYGQRPPL